MFPRVQFRLEVLPECASTQHVLLQQRGNSAFHGTAVLALRQTAGHGRRGREWTSFEGNLALSFGLTVPEAQLPLLTFACGLALFAATELSLPATADLRLKWPNDIYLDGKKLGGMLAQGRQVPGAQAEVVVGVGLNLARAPEGLEPPAVALSAYCQPRAPEEFARLFLTALEHVFDEYRTFPHLRADWEEAARINEGRLTIVGEPESVRAEQLLPSGELLVRYEDGRERKLASEEVSIRISG